MDFVIAVGATLVAKVVQHTFVTVRRLARYTSNVENLRAKIQKLETTKTALQGRVDQATQDIITEDVQNWINEAARISQEAVTFLDNDCQRANIKCFGGSLPNWVSRRPLSRRAKEKADELSRAIQAAAGDRFLTIASRPALQSCIADRDGYEDFVSRKKVLDEIMAVLSSDEVRKVGMYGMGGVGKTMLAKEVARLATEKKLFSEVVFTTISQTQDLKAIQQCVAEKIRLDLNGIESIGERSDRLKRRLKVEKKILIILDDIWDILDLGEVGLKFDDDQKGCKILMTSRSLDFTRKCMGAEKNILVEDLSWAEALSLFTTIVGTYVVEQPDFQRLAGEVVRECRGLPLAIRTVASALKDNDLSFWEDALFQLQNSAPTNIDGMLTRVYPSIRLSFDSSGSEEAKKLFLLCSLYGEDVGWGFFLDVRSVAAARKRVDSLVVKLKARCLLLDGSYCDMVKMHDVVRDVAIAIASEDSWGMRSFMINDRLEECLNEKRFKDTKAFSLLRNSNSIQLPERKLECPQLELFLISDNNYPKIPIMDFLNESTHLKVLSLCSADLMMLPSFNFLQNLKTLRLHNCKLGNIDYIGDLKNLRVLDLRWSSFYQLPLKIGKLTRLQLLNLQNCKDLVVIRENVISSLMELEELYMPADFRNWEAGEVTAYRRNTSVAELMNLQKLTTLFLSIPDTKILPKGFIFSNKLERYRIGIGIRYDDDIMYAERISRSLILRDCEQSLLMAHGLEALMRSSERLNLGGLAGCIKNNDLDKDGFPNLKSLELSNCDEIQYVVDALVQKSTIHPCKLTADSFKQLREVDVSNCGRLKNLFPLSIAKRLQKITVVNCEQLWEIVEHDQLREDEAAFDELLYLQLWSLPKLVQFICWPHLGVTATSSSVESTNYPLFGEKVALPKLKSLRLYDINVKKLWADQLPSTSNYMQNLSELYVLTCNELECVSSVDVAKSLVKLQKVEVKACRSLKMIFSVTKKQGGEEDGTSLSEKLFLPQLQLLRLADLPNLKTLCGTVDKEHGQLGERQPLFNGMIELSGLHKLHLLELNIESLWPDFDHRLQATTCYMENLTSLNVSNCNKLKYLVSSAMAERLVKLKKLKVSSCSDMEGIVAVRKKLDGEDQQSSKQILFPNLRLISLKNLSGLKSFCQDADKQEENELTKSFFHEKVAFPYLQCVKTDCKEAIDELFGLSQFPSTVLSCKLKELHVECTTQDKPISLSIFEILHRYQNLETFNLSGSFVNIKTCQSDGQDERILAQSLARPLMSVHNLTELNVSECHGLTYLLDSSTARSLAQLKVMSIRSCREMKDIIRDCKEGGTTEDDAFDFKRLEVLVLRDLRGLKSFYSGNNVMMFPRLQKLFVSQCPKMKSFSCGIVTTLILRTIITDIKMFGDMMWKNIYYLQVYAEPKWERWDGDVNTTIWKLWEGGSYMSPPLS